MEKLHSKTSVSPASGYSFPNMDSDNSSLFSEGVPNKPGVKDGFESASKEISSSKDIGDDKDKKKLPLGYDQEIEDQNLPKTGIHDRFLKYRPIFKGTYLDHEPIAYPVSPELAEIYKK